MKFLISQDPNIKCKYSEITGVITRAEDGSREFRVLAIHHHRRSKRMAFVIGSYLDTISKKLIEWARIY